MGRKNNLNLEAATAAVVKSNRVDWLELFVYVVAVLNAAIVVLGLLGLWPPVAIINLVVLCYALETIGENRGHEFMAKLWRLPRG